MHFCSNKLNRLLYLNLEDTKPTQQNVSSHLRNPILKNAYVRRTPLLKTPDKGAMTAMAEAFPKWGGRKPMTRFSSSTTKDGSGVARNFKRGGGAYFLIFPSVFFAAELGLIWSWLKKQESSRGVRGHAPPGNFWKFTCCNSYFSAFCIIFRQIVFKFFDPNFECFAKYDALCSHIFNYACLRC